MRLIRLCTLLLIGAALLGPGYVWAGSRAGPKVKIDSSAIYLGNERRFKSPAEVNLDAVYAKIPEYREIVQRGMDESNPRYLFLMRAASDRFRSALVYIGDEEGYDLIGGLGSIKIEGKRVPNITQMVIEALPE